MTRGWALPFICSSCCNMGGNATSYGMSDWDATVCWICSYLRVWMRLGGITNCATLQWGQKYPSGTQGVQGDKVLSLDHQTSPKASLSKLCIHWLFLFSKTEIHFAKETREQRIPHAAKSFLSRTKWTRNLFHAGETGTGMAQPWTKPP